MFGEKAQTKICEISFHKIKLLKRVNNVFERQAPKHPEDLVFYKGKEVLFVWFGDSQR